MILYRLVKNGIFPIYSAATKLRIPSTSNSIFLSLNRRIHSDDDSEIIDKADHEYNAIVENAFQKTDIAEHVLIIQPYVKWGPNKLSTKPDLQIQEAESLIKTLQCWRTVRSLKVPLKSLAKKTFFGKGKLDEIKTIVQQSKSKGTPFTSAFISVGMLSFEQKQFLTKELKLKIFDRYSIVVQILRLHATSTEAKIQVALAEIPYILNFLNESGQSNYITDSQKQIIKNRERKLRNDLEAVRNHRKLLRNKRTQKQIPVISVVGYTNAGKTSLIKALTNDTNLFPRDQLFATLDVTAHSGFLPSNLQVIFMDTVGFMSDLPTDLFNCFEATLEDVILSDLIIHVQDLSHENVEEQRSHVESTLNKLFQSNIEAVKTKPQIINVGNKIDLVSTPADQNMKLVSSKTLQGVDDLLKTIEKHILIEKNLKKRSLRVTNGGPELAWLYKNGAVTAINVDEANNNFLIVTVVISDILMFKFKDQFLCNK